MHRPMSLFNPATHPRSGHAHRQALWQNLELWLGAAAR